MSDNLCSRGIYGCKHDEGHIPTKKSVLKYFEDNGGYVLSRDLYDHFGCCTRERTDEMIHVMIKLEQDNLVKHVSASAYGMVGSDHPKVQKQQMFTFKELPPGKIHFVEDGVMIHDREGRLLFDYATTTDESEITCGLCLNMLKARRKKGPGYTWIDVK